MGSNMNRRTFLQRLVGGVVAAGVACRLQLASPTLPPNVEVTTNCIISDGLHILADTQSSDADYREWIGLLYKDQKLVRKETFRITRISFKLEYKTQVDNMIGEWLKEQFGGCALADSDIKIPNV